MPLRDLINMVLLYYDCTWALSGKLEELSITATYHLTPLEVGSCDTIRMARMIALPREERLSPTAVVLDEVISALSSRILSKGGESGVSCDLISFDEQKTS